LQVSARVDYALRAIIELAAVWRDEERGALRGAEISEIQEIPKKFLQHILLLDLKRAGFINARRGVGGGYQLTHPPKKITLAAIIRAVEEPLANVRGKWPEDVQCSGAAKLLQQVWIAVQADMWAVLDSVTLRDVVHGTLPEAVDRLTQDSKA
jgi:Rrf2 family protein